MDVSNYTDGVAGIGAFVSVHIGQIGLEAEYLGALDKFDTASLAEVTELTGQEPEAWNIELAWMPSETLQLAARYEESTDFMEDLQRYGATVSYGIFDNVVVALEYLNAETSVVDSGVDTVTAQLALEF